jgi:hypothetical protein
MQFTTPSQGAGMQASNSLEYTNDFALGGMGRDGLLTHLP